MVIHENRQREPPQERERNRDNLPKAVIPTFTGKGGVEEYLKWKDKMKRVFTIHHYAGPKQVDLAVSEFTEFVATWWDQSEKKRAKQGYPTIGNW